MSPRTAIFLPLVILSHFAIATLALVPANQTFKFINQGESELGTVEYDAFYRVIQNDVYTIQTFPFSLCFYTTTSNAYIFAIRMGIPHDLDRMRWVWDANRNDQVQENATLTFSQDGNLVLADADGRLVWQTHTANKGVTGIKLLSTGNLVLHDKNGQFIWQSFDYPTDTLLVGQSLKINGVNKLVSRTSDIDGSDGPYIMTFDHRGLNMHVNKSGESLIYMELLNDIQGVKNLSFDAIPLNDNTTAYQLTLTLENQPRLYLRKLNYNAKYSFLRLGFDGNLKAYTYYDKVSYSKWEEVFALFSSTYCNIPSKCGQYGLCDKGMCVACPTPVGLLGWSEACAPPKLAACRRGAKVDYYKIKGVRHFLMNPNFLVYGEGPMKVGECREKCNKDCKCVGFFYEEHTSKCLLAPLLGTLIKDVDADGYIKYSK